MRSSVNVAMPLRPLLWTTQRLGTCWHLWVRGASLASRYQCFGELLSCVLKRGEGWKIISYLWKLLETLVSTLHFGIFWPWASFCCHPAEDVTSETALLHHVAPSYPKRQVLDKLALAFAELRRSGITGMVCGMMMCLAKLCETSWHLRHLRHLRTLGSQHCCPILPSPNLEIWMLHHPWILGTPPGGSPKMPWFPIPTPCVKLWQWHDTWRSTRRHPWGSLELPGTGCGQYHVFWVPCLSRQGHLAVWICRLCRIKTCTTYRMHTHSLFTSWIWNCQNFLAYKLH